MKNYKYRLLIKLSIIWIIANIHPIINQLSDLTAYRINERVFSIPAVIFYSTISYLITLFLFFIINKLSFNKFGRMILLIIGIIPIILPLICYIKEDGLGFGIFIILDAIAILSGAIVQFFRRRQVNFIEGLAVYLSQFLGLYLIIIIWQNITNINFEIMLFVGLATLFLSNLFMLNELEDLMVLK